MRARAPKPVARAIVAPLAALLLIGALGPIGALGGCGSSSPSALALLDATFRSGAALRSGRVELDLRLSPPAGTAQPLTLHLAGPFRSDGSERLPSFALALRLSTAGRTVRAGATSAGGRLFVELGGTQFLAPESTLRALSEGYASTGIDPGRWLTDPVKLADTTVAGVSLAHVRARLDAKRFLADTHRFAAGGLLSAAQLSLLAAATRAARADVYTGSDDHRLRRLSLTGPGLTIELRFSDLGRPEAIAAPGNPRPLSELVSRLRALGVGG